MKKTFIIIAVLAIVSLACYAHAGMYDRLLEITESMWSVLKIIMISQIVVSLLLFNRLKWGRPIRKRLLLIVKMLSKKWWVNLIAAWLLSSFVVTSYLTYYVVQLWILSFMLLVPFFALYLIIVLWKMMRKRLLAGMKAMYFYLIASIGQIIGFAIHNVSVLEWYSMLPEYQNSHFCMFRYQWYLGISDGVHILIEGMLVLSVCLGVPYLLLMMVAILKMMVSKIRRR